MASSLVPLYLFSSLIAAAGQITQVNMWEVARKGFCMYTVLHQCSKCRLSQPPHQRGPMARSHICTLCCRRIPLNASQVVSAGRRGARAQGIQGGRNLEIFPSVLEQSLFPLSELCQGGTHRLARPVPNRNKKGSGPDKLTN